MATGAEGNDTMEYQIEVAQCLEELRSLQGKGDIEMDHIEADDCLVKFLISIGYGDIAYEYEQIHKWYA